MPVLMYNACTWALTQSEMDEIEAFRRKQLRIVIGVFYPRTITNEELYKKCETTELQNIIRGARRKMLGHVLRMTEDTPAKYAMVHYFDPRANCFRGRPRITLPVVINHDLERYASLRQLGIPAKLQTLDDLRQLEATAQEHSKWRCIVANIQVPPLPTRTMQRPRRYGQQ